MTTEGETVYSFSPQESVVVNTVHAVSEHKGVSPTDLRPLHGAIDPDALEKLLGDPGASVNVTFRYEGLDITIRTDDRISISEAVVDV